MRDFLNKYGSYLLSQGKTQVPSAMRDLTALFGKGRGEHPRQNHHKKVNTNRSANKVTYWGC